MKFDFENTCDLKTVGYGDVLIMNDDSKYLIVKDSDENDYVAVNLENFTQTDYESTVEYLIEYELGGKVVRIIKSENLILGVR